MKNNKLVQIGDKYGKLLVTGISYKESNHGRIYRIANCSCECGNKYSTRDSRLRRTVRHCGCIKQTRVKKYGISGTRLYNTWIHMIDRCYNKQCINYNDYGGRGIKVCESWKVDVKNFYEWAINNGYESNLTIERKDVNKDYSPDNCTWIEFGYQASNRRTTKLITAFGETKTTSEWVRDSRCRVRKTSFIRRINDGWEPELALTKESKNTHRYKLNILIPMSGLGSRFQLAGYTIPKMLLPLNHSTMIECVIDNLYIAEANFIFIVQNEHCTKYNIDKLLSKKCENLNCTFDIIKINGQTGGAAETVLMATKNINNNERLIVCNSDQIMLDYDTFTFLNHVDVKNGAGGVVVFQLEKDNKWSYIEINEYGTVKRIVEKQPISNLATTGLYYYRHGNDCVKYINQMIDNKDKTNNEYYFAPSMNYAIKDKKRIVPFQIEKMIPLGTPEDYIKYIESKNE